MIVKKMDYRLHLVHQAKNPFLLRTKKNFKFSKTKQFHIFQAKIKFKITTKVKLSINKAL